MLYQNFSFPLNVYAHILTLEYGEFSYLHYGMFEPNQNDVLVAQELASNMLLARIPVGSLRILEVGIGLGTTLSHLLAAGHHVVGITPDANQISCAQQLHGADIPVVCSRLEDFTRGDFDLLVFQESAQYIDTTSLFRKANELLVDGGRVLIMDEMALLRTVEPHLPLREDYVLQALTHGFSLKEFVDLSEKAAPTNNYIKNAITRHRESLVCDLGLPPEQIDFLLESAQLYEAKYLDGRYGYGLMTYQKERSI